MRTCVRMIACALIPRFEPGRRAGRPARDAGPAGGDRSRAGRAAGDRRRLGRGGGVRDHGGDAAWRGARPLPRPGPGPARSAARRGGVGGVVWRRSRGSGRRSSPSAPARRSSGSTACAALWGRPERAMERARRVAGRGAGWAPAPRASARWRRRFAPARVGPARSSSPSGGRARSSHRSESGSCATGWATSGPA